MCVLVLGLITLASIKLKSITQVHFVAFQRIHATALLLVLVLCCQASAQSGVEKDGVFNRIETGSLCVSGEGFFDYTPHRENEEAEILAMILSGELRAPDAEYDRIGRDLRIIRGNYPVLETIVDSPDFSPDGLIVRLSGTGSYSGYEAMNHYYQVIEDRVISQSLNIHLLTFCDNLNAQVVGLEYETLVGEVNYAEPDGRLGDATDIAISPLLQEYRYTFVSGFGDCMAGCKCRLTWVIDVHDDGTISLVSYSESNLLSCTYEETVCCLPDDACQTMAIGSCLDQDGTPLEYSAVCSACIEPLILPSQSTWGMVLATLLTLAMGTLILARGSVRPSQDPRLS